MRGSLGRMDEGYTVSTRRNRGVHRPRSARQDDVTPVLTLVETSTDAQVQPTSSSVGSWPEFLLAASFIIAATLGFIVLVFTT